MGGGGTSKCPRVQAAGGPTQPQPDPLVTPPRKKNMALPASTNCTAEDKLVGLATFLTVRYDFGGQLFSSRVRCCNGKRFQVSLECFLPVFSRF